MSRLRAYIALGSNLGRRAANIRAAVRQLSREFELEATASLYETAPAYVDDQPPFLNTVAAVRASCSPRELLATLKRIEVEVGRLPSARWGPRAIDLDLVLYGDLQHSDASSGDAAPSLPLELPHPRMGERRFVLEPLAEIDPAARHPRSGATAAAMLAALPPEDAAPLQRVCPLGSDDDEGLVRWGRRTLLMGVLNVTPDSFSDGGRFDSAAAATAHALELEAAGADIIDVGAVSTRPGAVAVSPEEELRRAAPVVQALHASPLRAPISVDTSCAAVAAELAALGARVVNDVSGGAMDREMLPTVARLGLPAVLMHMRGDPATMASLARYDDVVADVRSELAGRLAVAQAAGVPKWDLIGDPGIGFAKTAPQSLALLRSLHRFGLSSASAAAAASDALDYPLLVGVSRKSFLGAAVGVELPPQERAWATAAACAASVPHADILRVHDVSQMRHVAAVADAIHRGAGGGAPPASTDNR